MEVTLLLLAYLFAAKMCLPSRRLAINAYFDFAIPAFGRLVTVFTH
jgi:hypothetical protein